MKPINKTLLVKSEVAEEQTSSGIILPDAAKEKPSIGTIIAIAEDCNKDFKIGMKILYKKWGGNEVDDSQNELFIYQDDILAIIED